MPQYQIVRNSGTVVGVTKDQDPTIYPKGDPIFIEFLLWNAIQAFPQETEDQVDLASIKSIIQKTDAGITAADVKTAAVLFLRRMVK